MSVIKVVLIVCVLGLLLWSFRNRHRVGLRAGARLGAYELTRPHAGEHLAARTGRVDAEQR